MAGVLEPAEMAGCASTSVAREVFWWKRWKDWGGRLDDFYTTPRMFRGVSFLPFVTAFSNNNYVIFKEGIILSEFQTQKQLTSRCKREVVERIKWDLLFTGIQYGYTNNFIILITNNHIIFSHF